MCTSWRCPAICCLMSMARAYQAGQKMNIVWSISCSVMFCRPEKKKTFWVVLVCQLPYMTKVELARLIHSARAIGVRHHNGLRMGLSSVFKNPTESLEGLNSDCDSGQYCAILACHADLGMGRVTVRIKYILHSHRWKSGRLFKMMDRSRASRCMHRLLAS